MGFIKKHLFWVLCIAIVLVSAGIFVPGFLVNRKNRERLDKLGGVVKQVSQIRSTAANVNTTIVEQYERLGEMAAEDARAVQELTRRTTDRPLLYPEIFPRLRDVADKVFYFREFGRRYTAAVESYLATMGGGDRPSQLEERKVLEKYHERSAAGDTRRGVTTVGPTLLRPDQEMSSEEKLIDDLRRQRAQEIGLYASVDSFCVYDSWTDPVIGDVDVMLVDSWFSQIAHWIQEDVVLSIKQLNGDSAQVADSAVRRLIEVSFAGADFGMGGAQSRSSSGGGGTPDSLTARRVPATRLPCYVTREEDVWEGTLTDPWTQRASSDLVDVVHFEVAVVIDSRRLMDFMQALQSEKVTEVTTAEGTTEAFKRNQITVLDLQTEWLDVTDESAAGYYYGSGSLSVARLACEYVFFKVPEVGQYEQWKPDPVKQLGQEELDERY